MRRPLHANAAMLVLAMVVACDLSTDNEGLRTIALTPAVDSTEVGGSVNFQAKAVDGRGRELGGVAFAWSSSDTAVATVDTAGLVRGAAAGSATIRAEARGVTGQATIVVVAGPFTATCSGTPAIRHTGTISRETWRAAAGLHLVTDTLTVTDSLTIEAGAEVCTGPGAVLTFRSAPAVLTAVGTASHPIRFRPADGAQPEFLITSDRMANLPPGQSSGASVRLSYVEAEHTDVRLETAAHVQIDASRLGAVSGGYRSDVTVVGSVLRGAGIWQYSTMTLTSTIVRGGAVSCSWRAQLSLRGVRVEGSPMAGLEMGAPTAFWGRDCSVQFAGIRLVGNASIANLDSNTALGLLSQPGIADSLRGNRTGTLEVSYGGAGSPSGPDRVIPGYVQVVAPSGLPFGGPGTLRVEAGAQLIVGGQYPSGLGRVLALGTTAAPVRLSNVGPVPSYYGEPHVFVAGTPAQPSILRHMEVSRWGIKADTGQTVLVDSSHFSGGGGIVLRGPGSHIRESSVEDAADSAGIILGGRGVQMQQTVVQRVLAPRGVGVRIEADDVVVDGCAVSGAAGDGILVTAGTGIRINHCNLVGNAGAGLNNLSSAPVDARNNWWGDPGGPTAPGAARVLGNVLYTPWATAPLPIGPAPTSIALAPAAGTVTAGDTVRFAASALDATGARLEGAVLSWQVADTTIAAVVPSTGLLVALRAGTTTLRVASVSYPDIGVVATVTVLAGAPPMRWSEETGLPPGGRGNTVWASSPSDVYAGGGELMHFDGSSWTEVLPETDGFIAVVWGRNARDIYASRSFPLTGIPIWHGQLFHYDGVRWDSLAVLNGGVWGVWADPAGEIFAVGDSLWHYSPAAGWSATSVPPLGVTAQCYAVWGRTRGDVYAACSSGVEHFDGTGWSAIGGMTGLTRLWGTATAVYVAGPGGRIQRYDGQGWTDMVSGTSQSLYALAGTDTGGIYAAGEGGVVRYFDGTRWLTVWTGAASSIGCLAASGGHVYAGTNSGLLHGRPR